MEQDARNSLWSYGALVGGRDRVRQFLQALARHDGAAAAEFAGRYLSEAELALFNTMDGRDLVHSARTARNLLEAGHDDRELLKAALLHDVGKGRQRLPYRVTYVVLSRLALGLLDRVARPDGWGVRGALDRSLNHSRRGAEMAAEAGAGDRVARLIRLHHQGGDEPGLTALIEADNRA